MRYLVRHEDLVSAIQHADRDIDDALDRRDRKHFRDAVRARAKLVDAFTLRWVEACAPLR